MITLLSEPDVLSRWPALSKCGLRAARKTGRISWVRGKRGSAFYREEAIEQFIQKELEKPCRDHARDLYLNSAANGSPGSPAHPSTTDFGLSQELEEHAAQACARKI
jgi:hypothetical protein